MKIAYCQNSLEKSLKSPGEVQCTWLVLGFFFGGGRYLFARENVHEVGGSGGWRGGRKKQREGARTPSRHCTEHGTPTGPGLTTPRS